VATCYVTLLRLPANVRGICICVYRYCSFCIEIECTKSSGVLSRIQCVLCGLCEVERLVDASLARWRVVTHPEGMYFKIKL